MERNSLYLFKIFGIPIRVHVSWLIIFVLLTCGLAMEYLPNVSHYRWPQATYWIVGLVASLLFFLSVVLHEVAHSIVARMRGMKVRDIVLFIFGGVSELGDEPGSPGTEFLMAFVGPLTSVLIGLFSGLIYLLTKGLSEPVSAVAFYLFWINLVLAVFNLVPGFPLDGGRVLRSILWGVTGDLQRSTRWATRIGVVIAYAMILLGILLAWYGDWRDGIWIAFIGWFLNNAAQSSYSTMLVRHVLSAHAVREVLARDYPRVPTHQPLDSLVSEYILAQGHRSLPVMDDERFAGLVTVQNVKSAPRERWAQLCAADVMIPAEQVKATPPDRDLWRALEQMNAAGVSELAVVQDGQFMGMLRRDAIMGFLQVQAELKA